MTTPYYQDEWVTLYHGDGIEVLPSVLPRGSVHAIVTDPPFFMPAQQYAGRDASWQRSWADTSILASWFRTVCGALTPLVRDTGHFLVFCDDASYPVFYPSLYTTWPNLAYLVWDKGRPGMGTAWRKSSELIISARGRSAYWTGGATGNVLRHKPVHPSERLHPVDKPVPLLCDLIRPTVPAGGLVVDPFAGGGSTLVAASSLGLRSVGAELEERHCEVIARRLSRATLDFTAAEPVGGVA